MPVERRGDPNLALQALCLLRAFPASSVDLTPGRLIWTGHVRPLPACDRYRLRLEAERARVPSIRVMEPALASDDAGLLPHVYDTGDLCVSELGDFRPGMLFVDTVIPWALEWLVHYEQWRIARIWYGDGPDRLDPDSQASVLHPYGAEPLWPPRRAPMCPQESNRAGSRRRQALSADRTTTTRGTGDIRRRRTGHA